MSQPSISFEYFPPKGEKATQKFWTEVPKLAALNPEFMTVTYGAGGSTRDNTVETALRMARDTGVPVGMHLTFINTTKKELYALSDDLWDGGIRHLIALRGDLTDDLSWPLENEADYFQYTSYFVEGLRARHDFEISVGAYPEIHPDAPNLDADLEALKQKCHAGATRAMTQFFFDNDVYYRFIDQCEKAGIKTPIYPGLLPVHNFKSMTSFAKRCGANVPGWMHDKFDSFDDNPQEARKVAQDLLIEQATDLAAKGVEHIHFYTLNKADITMQAVQALRA